MSEILMPKATTVWLLDNTTLTFQQIATFTGMHVLEVQAFADGEVGTNIQPLDPVQSGILSKEELDKAQQDEKHELQKTKSEIEISARQKGPRYTPITKRSAKPNAIAWLINHYPAIKDSQIIDLIGTTKNTINNIRNNKDYKMEKVTSPESPVELGLCSKNDLDATVADIKHKG